MTTTKQKPLWTVYYTDDCDPCCGTLTMRMRGYDAEDVTLRFFEGEDAEGWILLRVERVRD